MLSRRSHFSFDHSVDSSPGELAMQGKIPLIALVVGISVWSPGWAWSQDRSNEIERLKREIELRDREIDVLKRENELLKREIAGLKKGTVNHDEHADAADPTRVTVDQVDYVYAGTSRTGNQMIVTVLATSRNGDRAGPGGKITIVDEEGEQYSGIPVGGFAGRPTLREGVTMKLTWKIGGTNAFTGEPVAPPPSVRITRYALVTLDPTAGGGEPKIEFRRVPAVVTRTKPK
jgi:hypothetical protein